MVEPEPVPEPAPVVDPFPDLPEGTSADDAHRRIEMINEQAIYSCYHEALLSNPKLRGPLEVRWGVDTGSVYSPAVKSTPDGHRDIGTCVLEAVASWQYPAWFTDLPRFHTWNLDPLKQSERLLHAMQGDLEGCSDAQPADVIAAHGSGTLFLVLEEGWVKSVEVKNGLEHEEFAACLLQTTRAWRLPGYATGNFSMYLTFGY